MLVHSQCMFGMRAVGSEERKKLINDVHSRHLYCVTRGRNDAMIIAYDSVLSNFTVLCL